MMARGMMRGGIQARAGPTTTQHTKLMHCRTKCRPERVSSFRKPKQPPWCHGVVVCCHDHAVPRLSGAVQSPLMQASTPGAPLHACPREGGQAGVLMGFSSDSYSEKSSSESSSLLSCSSSSVVICSDSASAPESSSGEDIFEKFGGFKSLVDKMDRLTVASNTSPPMQPVLYPSDARSEVLGGHYCEDCIVHTPPRWRLTKFGPCGETARWCRNCAVHHEGAIETKTVSLLGLCYQAESPLPSSLQHYTPGFPS